MDRADEGRLLGVIAQRATQFADEPVQVCLDDVRPRPDAGKQIALGDNARPFADEQDEQIEGLRRQPDLAIPADELTGVGIEGERVESDAHVVRRATEAGRRPFSLENL